MDDQTKAKQDAEQPKAGTPQPDGVKPGIPEVASPATAQQFTVVEQQMSGFERSTLRWARTAVILSGLAALIVCAQWWEMHEGGVDTHNLATATAIQAIQANAAVITAAEQAAQTKELAGHMKDQADGTKELADQAKIQANIGMRSLQAMMDMDQAAVLIRNPVMGNDANQPPTVQIELFNAGLTTAQRVRYAYRKGRITVSYRNHKETTEREIKNAGGTDFGSTGTWLQTPDIAYNGSVTAEFQFPAPRAMQDLDYAPMFYGKVEYWTIFNRPRWKRFCIIIPASVALGGRHGWDYHPQFCVIGQEGDAAEPNPKPN